MIEIPYFSKTFTIDTDALGVAVGAALFQENQVISIFCKKLSDSQKNYTNTERELLAIVKAFRHFVSLYSADLIARTVYSNLPNAPEIQTSRAQR